MNSPAQSSRKLRRWWSALLLLVVLLGVSGCQTLGYYTQAIKGQYQIIANRESIQKLLVSPRTPRELRSKLDTVEKLRAFARQELKLPVDGHYEKYVDVHRRYVVWNVVAAREFSLEPRHWWYPLVGSLDYRGYFSEAGAKSYGDALAKKGFDVSVGGVEAYSTLGWFKDPILNTFIFNPEPELAEVLFHELGHQRVFARSDTDFNEAFATVVGQEGTRRWLKKTGQNQQYGEYLEQIRRDNQFVQLTMETRSELRQLYEDEVTEGGRIRASRMKITTPQGELRKKKEEILENMRRRYEDLKRKWGGHREYDGWFAKPMNNAKLNSLATYHDLVPGFERLLAQNGGELTRFYEAAERLSQKTKVVRHERLRALASEHSQGPP